MADLIEDDRQLRHDLAALSPAVLAGIRDVLTWPQERRSATLRSWMSRPEGADLAELVSIADADELVRLRMLRAIRDLGV